MGKVRVRVRVRVRVGWRRPPGSRSCRAAATSGSPSVAPRRAAWRSSSPYLIRVRVRVRVRMRVRVRVRGRVRVRVRVRAPKAEWSAAG